MYNTLKRNYKFNPSRKRKGGGPRETWNKNVNRALKEFGTLVEVNAESKYPRDRKVTSLTIKLINIPTE